MLRTAESIVDASFDIELGCRMSCKILMIAFCSGGLSTQSEFDRNMIAVTSEGKRNVSTKSRRKSDHKRCEVTLQLTFNATLEIFFRQ